MNMLKLQWISLLAAGAFVVGCSGGDAGSDDSSEGAIQAEGVPVAIFNWPSDTTLVTARVAGGYQAPPPTGSECLLADEEITLDVATGKLARKFCDGSFNAVPEGELIVGGVPEPDHPYRWKTEEVTVTAAQIATVKNAVNGLERSYSTICGADAPSYAVSLKTASGSQRAFEGDFYACDHTPGVTYVTNIGSVFQLLRALVTSE